MSCYIALGGNLGDVATTFGLALARLAGHCCRVTAVSTIHRTEPVGGSGGQFLNAAAELETDLDPWELLDRLHGVEAEFGRTRETVWGPRTLDLDLLFYQSEIVESPRLTVPHPAAWYRRFVLDPLVEIAAEVVHPVKGATVRALRQRLLVRPLTIALAGGSEPAAAELGEQLATRFAEVEVTRWTRPAAAGAQFPAEPTFVAWLGTQIDNTAAETPVTWDWLPLLPRLDASRSTGPLLDFLIHVLDSALGASRV